MTDTQQKSAAKAFSEYWKDKGNEKAGTARFLDRTARKCPRSRKSDLRYRV